MGLLPLNYKRPPYTEKEESRRNSSESSSTVHSEGTVRSGQSTSSLGIPDALAFDKIINRATCPPCTVRDFMNYLIYVEHAAENLQFYLWYQDYQNRFRQAKVSDIALAPEWTQTMEDEALARIQKEQAEHLRRQPPGVEIFNGTDFAEAPVETSFLEGSNPFHTPPTSPLSATDNESTYASTQGGSTSMAYLPQAEDAFASVGAKAPFTVQPFRGEISRILSTYIMDGAPRQLNLSSREQKAVVQALAYTTHPSALRIAFQNVDSTLRRQAHPNFIRWSICNGNPARVWFARGLGVTFIAAGLAAAIVLTVSRAGRGWRALPAVAWLLGVSTLVAAYKGMCVVLHGLHHQHVRPWELFIDAEETVGEGKAAINNFDSLGSANSYESEPWVVRYEQRNIVRKIFDREMWIQEPALRQIQDTIFVQSLLVAVVAAGVLSAVFVPLPAGNLF